MFNSATLYQAKYGEALKTDFKKKFPGVCDEIDVKFQNCPKGGETGWADIAYLTGDAYYSVFGVYLGKLWSNCGLATVSGFFVGYAYRKKGIGTWLAGWVTKMLSEMGYTIAVGTTNPTQTEIHPLLLTAGWKEIESLNFTNRRTANDIKFWKLELPEFDKNDVPVMVHRGGLV